MNKSTKNLDALLQRQLLQELPLESPPPGGWAALKQELDKDADLQLKAALTSLAVAPATGWQALEEKLDPRTAADLALAEQLLAWSPAPVPGSWEVLAARMEAEQDQVVDAIISDQLARAGAGSTSGWAALAARLELIGWRRGVVAAWKIMEGAFLLSLLLLLVRFGPAVKTPGIAPVAMAEASPQQAYVEPAVAASSVSEVPAVIVAVTPALPAPKTAAPPATASVASAAPSTASSAFSPVAALPTQKTIAATASIPGLPIEKLRKIDRLPAPALQLPKMEHGEPVRYFVNAFVSPFDINEVVTPATSIGQFDISGDRRFTQGGSVGLLFDVQQGKNGLQIGAIYSQRSYIPSALKWYLQDEYEHTAFEPIKGYSRFRYENITFPFNYKRTVLERPNWRVSARVGMSLSVIARSSFEGQEDVVAGFNALAERAGDAPPNYVNPRSLSRTADFSGRHRLENPPSGWLEGGSILANSSFYLGGGIVVERLLDPRWSVYLSPSFGRVVYLKEDQGIGPYNDRIHVGNLRFGSRYRFGRK